MLAQARLERILGPVFYGPLSFYITNHEKTTKISNRLHALTIGQVRAESPHAYLMEFSQTKRAALPFTTEQIRLNEAKELCNCGASDKWG